MKTPDIILVRLPDRTLGVFKRVGANQHPMNLVCLATWLKQQGFLAEIIDLQVEPFTALEKRLKETRPFLVGITAMTPDIPGCRSVAALCASLGIKTVLGGAHPTAMPARTIDDTSCDYVVAGEGEKTLEELLRAVAQGRSPDFIKGLSFTRDGRRVVNPRAPLMDICSLPVPDRRFLKLERYSRRVTPGVLSRAATLFTSRGCPHGCVFCASPMINQKRVRFRPLESVFAEVDDIVQLGFSHLTIDDDSFTLDEERVVRFCEYLIGRFPGISWDCDSRVDAMNDRILGLMKRSNCKKIAFGVESGSPRMLETIGKHIDTEKVREAFRLTRKHGILAQGFFMTGFPEETAEDIAATERLIGEIRPDFTHVTTVVPFPGTGLYDEMTEKGFLTRTDWASFYFFNDVIPWRTRWFSGAELVRIRKRICRRVYFRPYSMLKRLLSVRSPGELLYLIRGGLVALRAFCR